MSYSIRTKDGIQINNIPDDVEPNSDRLRQRVAEIRAQQKREKPEKNRQIFPAPEANTQESTTQGMAEAAGNIGLEFAAGVNRGATELLDFLGPDQINAILQLFGSEKRIPTLTDTLSAGTQGGFMEEGLPRDAVRAAGEVIPSAVGIGASLRAGANQLPKIASGGESVARGTLRDMGRSTAVQDAVGAGLSAAGGEVGAEYGGDAGRVAGTFLAPMAAPAAKAALSKAMTPSPDQMIKRAAPGVDQLKDKASQLYQQIDDMGVKISEPHVGKLVSRIANTVKNAGFHPKIHPKVAAALDEVTVSGEGALSVSDVDKLRRVVGAAAKSIEPDEQRIARLMMNDIDSFLDDIPKTALSGGDESAGETLRQARQLWSRASKARMLDDAVEKAQNQASGFENGLRVQFRQILNNKKKMAGFSAEERDAIKTIVRGGPAENIARALGKFGFTEGQASSMLMGSIGVAAGAAVGGPFGAAAVPVAGTMAKKTAQRMTKENAVLANALVRAGKDGRRIAKAYIDTVPANKRSVEELTGLLLQDGVSLKGMPKTSSKLVSDAAYFASVLKQAEENQSSGQSSGSGP